MSMQQAEESAKQSVIQHTNLDGFYEKTLVLDFADGYVNSWQVLR